MGHVECHQPRIFHCPFYNVTTTLLPPQSLLYIYSIFRSVLFFTSSHFMSIFFYQEKNLINLIYQENSDIYYYYYYDYNFFSPIVINRLKSSCDFSSISYRYFIILKFSKQGEKNTRKKKFYLTMLCCYSLLSMKIPRSRKNDTWLSYYQYEMLLYRVISSRNIQEPACDNQTEVGKAGIDRYH